MGYTHYWHFAKKPTDIKDGAKKFKKAVELTKKGISKIPAEIEADKYNFFTEKYEKITLPFALGDGHGENEPIFTNTLVCFNGRKDEKSDWTYETFYINFFDEKWGDFCKTQKRPYDVAVCLTLICFKKCFDKDFTYSSDGDMEDWGWKIAHDIFDSF